MTSQHPPTPESERPRPAAPSINSMPASNHAKPELEKETSSRPVEHTLDFPKSQK